MKGWDVEGMEGEGVRAEPWVIVVDREREKEEVSGHW